MNEQTEISAERLKEFEPISSLATERLEELCTLSTVEKVVIGMSLFREGDVDNQTVYLLKGDVRLTSSDGSVDKEVSAGSPEAKHPLDDSQPRQVSCVACGLVEFVRIDNSVLDYMMMWDQMADSDIMMSPQGKVGDVAAGKTLHKKTKNQNKVKEETSGDNNWMRKMRHIMAFKALPPANLKMLLERMETVEVRSGDVIVQQGDPGEFYYVLTQGEAQVTRSIKLAAISAGSSFGEEAIVSGGKRNASVTMQSDGVLMRLSKQDFEELLKEPLLNRVSPDDARMRVAKDAKWLDVRHAKEFHHSRLPGAINIPLHELRMRIGELDKATPYICYCGTGRRSSAAAFLLIQQGYQVSVLNGGAKVMPQDLQY